MIGMGRRASDNTLFWRIAGGGRDSWMLGTIHAGRWRSFGLPQVVSDALQQSDILFTESAVQAGEQAAMIAKTRLPEGVGLGDVIGARRLKTLFRLVKALGVNIPKEIIERHNVWFSILMLSTPSSADSSDAPLDLVLHEAATSSGKDIQHLEDPEEHMSVLTRFTDEESLAILDETMAALKDDGRAFLNNLLDLYGEGRVGDIVKLMDCRHSVKLRRKFRSVMLNERNERFADRLSPHLERGGIFASFGAAHLPGVKGVVGLLRRKGFGLEPVRVEMPPISSPDA